MEIGRGVQYKVIDIGEGRVLKIPLTTDESYAVVASRRAPNQITGSERLRIPRYRSEAIESCHTMQQIIEDFPLAAALVGHPVFKEDGMYIQDKVVPLETALNKCPTKVAKDLLSKYVRSNLTCWSFGFAEHVYNFSVNNGVDAEGNLVLIDFGEITTDYARVTRHVSARKWLDAYSYTSLPDQELRMYYAEITAELLSVDSLARSWQSAHQP